MLVELLLELGVKVFLLVGPFEELVHYLTFVYFLLDYSLSLL